MPSVHHPIEGVVVSAIGSSAGVEFAIFGILPQLLHPLNNRPESGFPSGHGNRFAVTDEASGVRSEKVVDQTVRERVVSRWATNTPKEWRWRRAG